MAEATLTRPLTEDATEAEAKGQTEGEVQKGDVTDPNAEVRTPEAEAAAKAAEGQEEDSLHRAMREAREAELKEEGRREALAELAKGKEATRTANFRTQLNDALQAHLDKQDSILAEQGLTEAARQEVVWNPGNAFGLSLTRLANAAAHEAYSDYIDGLVPEARRPDYLKAVEGKDIGERLQLAAEELALNTKAVKNLSLEQAVKLSATVRKDLEAAEKAARELGRKDPAGERTGEERSSIGNGLGPDNYRKRLEAGELPSPAEIDAMTAKQYGVGV